MAIHSSVVNFLQTQPQEKGMYIPLAKWCGYPKDELPWIEDGLKGSLDWNETAAKAMMMDWKPEETWGAWFKKKVGLHGGPTN